jgi:hypothetical protein
VEQTFIKEEPCYNKPYRSRKGMNKYPLIGVSILAVVLLVLGSLSNVVGYQSVQSTASSGSPLFTVRTKRAISQAGQTIVTSNYLGKGTGNLLQIPAIDNKTETLKRTIEIISKMDDKTFEQFTETIIRKARQDKTITFTNNEIIQILQLLRKQSKTFLFYLTNKDTHEPMPTYEGVTFCVWAPGCFIIDVIMLLFMLFIYIPLLLITSHFHLTYFACNTTSECHQ